MSNFMRHLICGAIALIVFIISGFVAMQFIDNDGFWSTNIIIAAAIPALIVELVASAVLKRME